MQITDNDVFLDFETRSRVDLAEVGSWRYAEDQSTSVLCLAYAQGMGEPFLWADGMPPPQRLLQWIAEGKRIHGWNSMSFERAIFEVIIGPKYGWPTPPLEQYYDTMSDALALALPGKLSMCGEALNASTQKDKEGHKVMMRLSKPISAGKLKGQFRERDTHRADYASLYAYCKQDVKSEREIYSLLPFEVTGKQREVMLTIARINERGLPIDIQSVRSIAKAIEEEKDVMKVQFHLITGIDSPTKRAKFLAWLNDNGLNILDTQKETLRDALKSLYKKLSSNVREAIILAQAITRTANAKYQVILNSVCKDGTVKNNLIWHKASTGRLAGAGFQIQNLPSECDPESELMLQAFADDNIELIRLYNGVLETASSLVRSMIKAKNGHKFLNGDLKGVEMRGSAWASREWALLEKIAAGLDPYKITAAGMYHIAIDKVTKEQRQAGKISVLAGGFGGAHNAIINMARKMGIEVAEEDAKAYSKDFRKARPKLVNTWYAFGNAAVEAIENPGSYAYPTTKDDGPDTRFKFIVGKGYLFLVLPSGRKLSFPFPEVHEEFFKGYLRKNVTAMWIDSTTHQWTRRTITGASFFQSAVQALCCDLLMEAHLRTEAEGLPLILSVHDEQQSEVPDDARFTVKRYEEIMCVVPEWAKRFPVAADCWEGYRFKK